ncbi:carbohydrate-binding protein [Streptomyces sp. 8N616]|uniref:carbohydrate-binding protein n=1 Tax=Streptomyces sp. 8N616 TaxID=3457414 RepID=UPI003FD3BB3A
MRPRRGPHSDDRAESRSDAKLLSLVREGWTAAFGTLYRRHYPAVFGYAAHCVRRPADAHQLACRAYAEVLRETLEGTVAVLDRRHHGCLRLRLLNAVRTTAVQMHTAGVQGQACEVSFTPRFRSWVARGCQWPLYDDRPLITSFTGLPECARCLLWHAVVERDEPGLVARITGLDPRQLALRTRQAVDMLHRAVADPGTGAGSSEELSIRLRRMLPPLLLGWWPGHTYQVTKTATAPPEREPRFLERALLGLDIESLLPEPAPYSLPGSFPEPMPETGPELIPESGPGPIPETGPGPIPESRHGSVPEVVPTGPGRRPGERGTGAAGRRHPLPLPLPLRATGLGAVGFIAVLAALVCLPKGEPTAQDNPPVPADTYAVQARTVPGRGEHPQARALGPSSWLRYDRVDFTGAAATRLNACISAPVGGRGVLEVRLDSLAARPLAVLAAPADGSVGEVSTPIPATRGVHEVYLTARCSTPAAACTEVLWFGAGRPGGDR